MFCQKCGSIMLPKKEGSKKLLACSCGYKSTNVESAKIKETVPKKGKEVEVITKGELETLPKMKVKCPKCEHDTAYYWLVQTRAGDEPETKFLRCQKCEHTWRDYN
jgi:transcription factor S